MSMRTNMRKGRKGAFLALVLSVLMLLSVFPSGALVLDADMIDRLANFVTDSGSGKLDMEDYKKFIEQYLTDLDAEEGKGYLDQFHELITDSDQVPEYGKFIDYFKKTSDQSDGETIRQVLGVLQRAESVEEVFQFMKERIRIERLHKEATQAGTTYEPIMHRVEWYLEGCADPVVQYYEHQSVLFPPDVSEFGSNLNSSQFVNWHTPGFFVAPGNPGEVTRYEGTIDSMAERLVEIINTAEQFKDLWTGKVYSGSELAKVPLAGHNFMLLVPIR